MATSSRRTSQFNPQKYPVHVWLEILEPLLSNPERSKESLGNSGGGYQPFQNAPTQTQECDQFDKGAQPSTSRSAMDAVLLLLVCKEWYDWLSPSLYRHIRIHHGTEGLLEGLRRRVAGTSVDYGGFVRHVQVDIDPLELVVLCNILTCCPRITTLTRPYNAKPVPSDPKLNERKADQPLPSESMTPKGNANVPVLYDLHRLDWWDKEDTIPRIESPPFLHTLIRQAPNLRYLTTSRSAQNGWCWRNPFRQGILIPTQRSLSISTLRLQGRIDPLDLFHLDLPNLTHLILPQPREIPIECPTALGRQIKTLEITASGPRRAQAQAHGDGMASDYVVSRLWRTFPNVWELALPLSAALEFAGAQTSVVTLANLRVLRLNGQRVGGEGSGLAKECTNSVLKLEDLLGSRLKLPRLEEVVLHGASVSWR